MQECRRDFARNRAACSQRTRTLLHSCPPNRNALPVEGVGSAGAGANAPVTVDEVAEPRAVRVVEAAELLGRHGQIGVENGEQIVRGMPKSQAHGVVLALPRLPVALQLEFFGVRGADPLDLFPRAVIR